MTSRAVLWVAVSSKPQAEDDKISLATQEESARAYCMKQGYSIVDILKVPGHSRSESDVITALEELAEQGCFAYEKLRAHWKAKDFDLLLAFDSSRIARSASLFTFVVENVIKSGAEIHLLNGGRIDAQNADFQIALGGIAATSGIKRLVTLRDAAMNQRVGQGLPTTSDVCWSHQVVRDARGKVTRIIPDETRRPILEAVARLLIAGVVWHQIERQLALQYGYLAPDGRPWYKSKFYNLFNNPQFWGNSARFWRDERRVYGLWAMEAGHDIPAGVVIHYGTHEAVWPVGHPLGDLVRAELHRRHTLSRRSQRFARKFSGLLICAECGYNLSIVNVRKDWVADYRCVSRYERRSLMQCIQHKLISERTIQQWLDDRLRLALAQQNVDYLFGDPNQDSVTLQIRALEKQIADLEDRLRRAMQRQLDYEPGDPASALYDEEIRRCNADLQGHQTTLALLHQQALMSSRDVGQRQKAFQELQAKPLDDFWQQDGRTVNQVLHRLLGKRRLVVRDGQIIGTANAPAMHRNRRTRPSRE